MFEDALNNESVVVPTTPLRNGFRVTAPASLSSDHANPSLSKSIEGAYNAYRGRCKCEETLSNDCAHYVSDAFIRAGYTELDGGWGSYARKHNGRAVCKAGRPIRAREMREWFRQKATNSRRGEPNDRQYWAVFQLDTAPGSYWGGHVVIHRHDGRAYDTRGTGDFPNWRIQEHYTW
jgi:hypothetical protein